MKLRNITNTCLKCLIYFSLSFKLFGTGFRIFSSRWTVKQKRTNAFSQKNKCLVL